jgi:4-carboxymuconolactone decarboxylase
MDQARLEQAQAESERIFGRRWPTDARPWEPESAADLWGLLMTQAFGDSWTRTALDDRTRSIVTVSVLTALGLEEKLKGHVGGAIKLGVSEDELVDLFVHLSAYLGVARAGAGWEVVSEVLQERYERRAKRAVATEGAGADDIGGDRS